MNNKTVDQMITTYKNKCLEQLPLQLLEMDLAILVQPVTSLNIFLFQLQKYLMSQINIRSNPQNRPQDQSQRSSNAVPIEDHNKNSFVDNSAKPEYAKNYDPQNQRNENRQNQHLEPAKPSSNFYAPKEDERFEQEGAQYGSKVSKFKHNEYVEDDQHQKRNERSEQQPNNRSKQKTQKFEKRNKPGVIIRIVRLEARQKVTQVSQSIIQKFYIKVRNEANVLQNQRQSILMDQSRRTKLVNSSDPVWNEDFFYNSSKILDDNITFILCNVEDQQIARSEVRNFSERNVQMKRQQVQKKEILLKNEERTIGTLFVEVSFFENGDLVGGVKIPQLSLRPPKDFKPKYNAVDGYKPEFTSQKGKKANCFNFLDGDIIPGFDNIEAFPSKFVQPNKRKDIV